MAIGLVSDEEFFKELKSGSIKSDSTPRVEVLEPEHGRKPGDVNIPDSLRQIIGEEAAINGRQEALKLAAQFGVSSSSVSAYAKGSTSTTSYHQPSSSILTHINKSKERAVKRASKTLNSALSAISQDKLDYADAKDLSSIAKDMSAIIKNLEPAKESDSPEAKSAPQFVIYAPQFRDERSFEVINQSNE